MKYAPKEAKSVIHKSHNDMAKYYNQWHTPTPVFKLSDKMFLDSVDIYIMYSSIKLFHWYLRSYIVKNK